MLLRFVGLVIAITALPCRCEEVPDNPVKLFKDFLKEPPVLKELIFSRTIYGPTPWKAGSSPEQEFFCGRLQSDAFVFRNVKTLADTTSTITRLSFLVGRYQDDWWFISNYDKADILECWFDNGILTTNNPVKMTAESARTIFNVFLHMGAPLVNFEKAEWDGNDLVAVSIRGEPIKGRLFVADNKPQKLVFNVFGNPFFSNRTEVIEYYYEKNPGIPYLPNRFKILAATDEKQNVIAEVQIRSIATSSTNLGREFFDAKQFYVPGGRSWLFFTNNAEYALRNGQLTLARRPATIPAPSKKNILAIRAMLLLIFTVPLILLAWHFLRSKQKTTK